MAIVYIKVLRRHAINLMVVLALGCDSFDGDGIEPQRLFSFSQTEFYILPGSSMVIDLKSLVEQSLVNILLTVSQHPTNGTLSQMDPFILKYTPHSHFLQGEDQIVFSGRLADGTIIKSEPVKIFVKDNIAEFPCDIYSVEDNVRYSLGTTTVIHVLKNDRICDITDADVFIRLNPKFGDATVAGDSIIYTRNSSFTEGDELVYGISTVDEKSTSFGLVSFNKIQSETIDIPLGINDIFFLDDATGFMAGQNQLYKTTDGGLQWVALDYPSDQIEFLDFRQINFVDKNNGFVAFSSCDHAEVNSCEGGWMKTTNGGASWIRVNLDVMVHSVFFTSPLVGFMSTWEYNAWEIGDNTFIRTVDGGRSWEYVSIPTNYFGNIDVRFANEDIGYAFQPGEIFITKDGGESWTSLLANNYVVSLAVAGENVVSASLNATLSATTPGTIVRSENGAPFTTVSNYPYSILCQRFSPSGDLGLAVGINYTNTSIHPEPYLMAISKSTDKGATWSNLPSVLVDGLPQEIAVPSERVAYILSSGKIIKYIF